MTAIAFFAAVSFLGIDVGWQPAPGGGLEYTIQISPENIEALRAGEAFQSDVPPEVLRDMRSYRITVGNKRLLRTPPVHPAAEHKPPAAETTPRFKQKAAQMSAAATAPPAPLPPNPASKPMTGQQAVFNEAAPAEKNSPAEVKPAGAIPLPSAAKPWLPLWLTAVALFASLGANVYLGWITIDVRRRWRTLVEKTA